MIYTFKLKHLFVFRAKQVNQLFLESAFFSFFLFFYQNKNNL
jgi:hypothetical protein